MLFRSNDSVSAVPLSLPTAQNQCTAAAAPVSGTVIQYNGASTSIPVVNGTVQVPPGSGVIRFVATNASGVTTTADRAFTVLAPPTFFGVQGITVDGAASVHGTVYSDAGGLVSVGTEAIVSSIVSLSPVLLHDQTTVDSINTDAGLTMGNNNIIGSFSTSTPLLPPFPKLDPKFAGGKDIVVSSGMTETLIPDQYGMVTVLSGGKLVLSAGEYYVTLLDLELGGEIVTPSTQIETAQVFVNEHVIYRGRTVNSFGVAAPLYLAYINNSPIQIESAYLGTIIAPYAQLTLNAVHEGQVHAGEFFASQVLLAPRTTVNSIPFTCH